jgi:CRP/FNR family transcriptional regulator, anaerobic regulatory protein
LRSLRSFSPNTPEEIDFIQRLKMGELVLGAGADVFREGEKSDHLFTLLEGWAFRYRTLREGGRQIIQFLLPGDFIGLQQKIGSEATQGVQLLTDGRLCRFPDAALWRIHREHPSLGYDVTWIAAHDELIVDENLVSVGRRSAMQRIAMILIHLYKRAESVGLRLSDGSIEFPVTQQHLSDALGLSLAHTNKCLRKLENAGFYELDAGRLFLRKPAALREIADYFHLPLRNRPLI